MPLLQVVTSTLPPLQLKLSCGGLEKFSAELCLAVRDRRVMQPVKIGDARNKPDAASLAQTQLKVDVRRSFEKLAEAPDTRHG